MAVLGKISSATQQRSGKLKFVAPFWEEEAGNDPEVGKAPLPHPHAHPQQGEHKEDWNRSLMAYSYTEHHPLQAVLRSCLVTRGQLVCPTCVTVKASFQKHASVVCSLKVSPLPSSSVGWLNLSTRLRVFTLPASQRPVHGGGVSFELSGGG